MKRYAKWTLTAVAIVAVALIWGETRAQQANQALPPTVVAVCDVVQVFNNNARAHDLQARLEKKRDAIEAENQKRQKAIEDARAVLLTLKEGQPQYEKTLDEIQRLTIERQAWLEFENQRVLREHKRLTQDLYDEILATIASVSERRGIDVVLYLETEVIDTENTRQLLTMIERRKVLYAGEQVDITEDVLRRLNDAYRASQP